jgi:hypothetical protein
MAMIAIADTPTSLLVSSSGEPLEGGGEREEPSEQQLRQSVAALSERLQAYPASAFTIFGTLVPRCFSERGFSHFDVSVQLGHEDGGALVWPATDTHRRRRRCSG